MVHDDFGNVTQITDPLDNVTEFLYDENGNMVKVIDALARETDYAYDSMNNLTSVTSPSGSANTMTMAYNVLGLLESRTDFEGKTTEYEYDYIRRLVQELDATQTPSEPVVTYSFNHFGEMATVTDGLSHTTSYTYNDKFQLTKTTDAINKQTQYTYDTAGRVTKAAAGSSGTVDPTEYFFSSTTGLLTKVRYTSGANSYDADYSYDAAVRLTQIDDWLGGNGLRYDYDAAGRLTELTDYDDSTLTYAYDDAGNVTSMTDYHNNTVSYTYDAANRLYTLTAPGSKVWTYTYNALGQPTQVNIPNGMHTAYSYDTRNRLTEIAHKDGSTVKESFGYTLDDDGNITKITHEDDSYWDYDYDGRNRLTYADRKSSSGNVVAKYRYTYDDSDNMLTKKEPFEDDFADGAFTNAWTALNNSWWQVVSGTLKTVVQSWNHVLEKQFTDADHELQFDYISYDTSNTNYYIYASPRETSGGARIMVQFNPGAAYLKEIVPGTGTVTRLTDNTVTTTQDEWYHVRIVCDGSNVKVWRWQDGELAQLIFNYTTSYTTTYRMLFVTPSNSNFAIDNIRILADNLENSYTFSYNNANELTSMAGPNGTTSFTYDDWGRQATQTLNSVTDTYAYRYGSKLYSVDLATDSNIDVTFNYGGDHKRRTMTAAGVTTGYNWDAGWNVINEELSGTLARTYFHHPQLPVRATMAHVDGTSPATGAYNYYTHDHLGSTRALYDATKALVAAYAYTPYGQDYDSQGTVATTHRFTGHDWNPQSGLYFAPHRFYNPELARWMSRDPLGMVDGPNIYAYVRAQVVTFRDSLGLTYCERIYPNGRRERCDCPDEPHPCDSRYWPRGMPADRAARCQDCCYEVFKHIYVDPLQMNEICHMACLDLNPHIIPPDKEEYYPNWPGCGIAASGLSPGDWIVFALMVLAVLVSRRRKKLCVRSLYF